jgi:peptide/nickel transport system ATP-binding protein
MDGPAAAEPLVQRELTVADATPAAALPGAAVLPFKDLARLDGVSAAAGPVNLLDGIDLAIGPGEALGLMGESGSGKSLTCAALARMLPGGVRLTAGRSLFRGADLATLSRPAMERLRGRGVAMIFQDPVASLNPLRRVGGFLTGLVELYGPERGAAARARAEALLAEVGLPTPARLMRLFPHELSGGQNQRVMIAGALAGRPALLIADEPTTALDVTTQAQILDLLADLRTRTGMGLLIVSHDFGVIAEAAGRVAVMYAGRIVEEAPVRDLLAAPLHPYTAGLLASIPMPGRPIAPIPGQPVRPSNRPPGCAFAPRCTRARAICGRVAPTLRPMGTHRVACHDPLSA